MQARGSLGQALPVKDPATKLFVEPIVVTRNLNHRGNLNNISDGQVLYGEDTEAFNGACVGQVADANLM